MALKFVTIACLVGAISAHGVSTSISFGGSDLSNLGFGTSLLGLNSFGGLFGGDDLFSTGSWANSSISIGALPALLILLKTPLVILFKMSTQIVSIVALSLFISHLGKQLGYDPMSFFSEGYDDYDTSSYATYSDDKGNAYDVPETSYETNTIHRRARSTNASPQSLSRAFVLIKNAIDKYTE